MTGEDDCLVPSEEDSSDEELKQIIVSEEQKNVSNPCSTTTPPTDPHFSFPSLSKSEHGSTEPVLVTGYSQVNLSYLQNYLKQLKDYSSKGCGW